MIRPFTVLCLLLAAGAGLYLYQAKQRTLQLDRRIDVVLRETEQVRAKTAMLHADYADLSRPDRLLALSNRYLALRPTEPSQFVELSALAHALPPIGKLTRPMSPDMIVPLLGAPPAGTAPPETPGQPAAAPAATLVSLATRSVTDVGATPAPHHDTGARPTAARPPTPVRHPTRLAEATPAPRPTLHPSMHLAPRPPAPPPTPTARWAAPRPPMRASGGSMLGDAGAMAMPPPVPVAN